MSEALAGAAVLGMNTVRLWAFNDGLGTSWPLQPVDGWMDNVTLGALDWVVDEARWGWGWGAVSEAWCA